MKILVLNGPNLNMLGVREPEIYGSRTLGDLEELIREKCGSMGIECEFYQSNYEGALVERIQKAYNRADGIIINAGAYTHTSVAILDALLAVRIPTVEVHLSDLSAREDFRKISFISSAAIKVISGKGFQGYLEAVDVLYKENHRRDA